MFELARIFGEPVLLGLSVVGRFDKEAIQTRDYCVAKNATQRAARPDPSRRKERLLRMTINLARYATFLPRRHPC
jgi:hypothetical protein